MWTLAPWKPYDEWQRRAALTESERLREEADAEERTARNFKGCSWMGAEHPSAVHYRRAAGLRQLADKLEAPMRAAQRRKERAEQRHAEFVDSMREDRDF